MLSVSGMRIRPRACASGVAPTGAAMAGADRKTLADAAIRVRSFFTGIRSLFIPAVTAGSQPLSDTGVTGGSTHVVAAEFTVNV